MPTNAQNWTMTCCWMIVDNVPHRWQSQNGWHRCSRSGSSESAAFVLWPSMIEAEQARVKAIAQVTMARIQTQKPRNNCWEMPRWGHHALNWSQCPADLCTPRYQQMGIPRREHSLSLPSTSTLAAAHLRRDLPQLKDKLVSLTTQNAPRVMSIVPRTGSFPVEKPSSKGLITPAPISPFGGWRCSLIDPLMTRFVNSNTVWNLYEERRKKTTWVLLYQTSKPRIILWIRLRVMREPIINISDGSLPPTSGLRWTNATNCMLAGRDDGDEMMMMMMMMMIIIIIIIDDDDDRHPSSSISSYDEHHHHALSSCIIIIIMHYHHHHHHHHHASSSCIMHDGLGRSSCSYVFYWGSYDFHLFSYDFNWSSYDLHRSSNDSHWFSHVHNKSYRND